MIDHEPGRRDILAGAAAIVGLLGAGGASAAVPDAAAGEAQNAPGYYPPERTGMRGSHPGAFEGAHALRDGTLTVADAEHIDEPYDIVIVGGGISGLSAAWFYRQARPAARILILDNHDDFGGHAKRNEVHVDGHMLLLNGGTLEIDSPRPYSAVATGLLTALGIRPAPLEEAHPVDPALTARKLGRAVFLDRETFGRDMLVKLPPREGATVADWLAALKDAPLTDKAKRDIATLQAGKIDYLPGLTAAETADRLSRISYAGFLTDVAKADPQVVQFYQTATHGEYGIGIDAWPALDCWTNGIPGFAGLTLDPQIVGRMGNTAAGYSATGGSESFHFPDGNASIARALVRALVPGVAPAGPIEAIVTQRFDYAALDRPGQPVRIRLGSIAVKASPRTTGGVDITYLQAGKLRSVGATHCVLACYNMMIPYLVPELPDAQKAALHALVKVPLVYTSVALRNWRAFDRLGIQGASCPGSYFSSFQLYPGPDIGGYTTAKTPDEPIMLHMLRTPCQPGLPTERDQHRAGRYELLATPIETFEGHVRDQLTRALGNGGFDAGRDLAAIIVNRWPHGYAYEYNPLYDPWDIPESQRPHVIGRQRFGPIAIANSDAGAAAYTDSAIDQAHRAVSELLSA